MAYKVSLTVAALLALSLMVVGVFALASTTGEFDVSDSIIYANWINGSNTDLGCYSNLTSITNNLGAGAINLTIVNLNSSIPLTVYNGNEYDNTILIPALTTKPVYLKYETGSLTAGTHLFSIEIRDTGNPTEKAAISLNLTKPTDIANLITAPIENKRNVNVDGTINVTFGINNTESYDLIITGVNYTNLTDGTGIILLNEINLGAGSIVSGENVLYGSNYTINKNWANTSGLYIGTVGINTSNGCTYQSYNLPVNINLTNELDNSIVSIINTTLGNDMALPGGEINIIVNPRYWDGTLVTGLTNDSFSIWIDHKNNSILTTDAKYNLTLDSTNLTENVDSYTLKTFIPSSALGGNYIIYINATDGLNSDIAEYSTFVIDQTALKLTPINCGDGTLHVGNNTYCGFNLTNYGYRTAKTINISYYPENCLSVNPTSKSSFFDVGVLTNYTDYTTITGLATGTCNLWINATTSNNVKWDVQDISISFAVSISTIAPTSDNPVTTVSNIVNTYSHAMTVTAPSAFELTQGGTASKTVTVKNTGTYVEKAVALSISGIDASWYTIATGEQLFSSGQSRTYDVSFKIPETAEPGSYTVKFTAKGSTVSGTGSTTLKVLPNANTQTQIKTNLSEYKVLYDNLLLLFNQSKASGKNISADIEGTLNEITGLITKADSYVESGKYMEAYQTIVQLRALMTKAQEGLTGAAVAGSGFNFSLPQITPEIGAVIVAAIAVIGVVIYFVKKKPSKPKMPSMKRSSSGFGDKLKDRFKK
ncbi:MAG: hypothetical protein PHU12_03195 [Candidatus Aenigmarchaeota archaeon]|nr:hypothetical protein [Candidatus Aenigmarchaeota archaeon]